MLLILCNTNVSNLSRLVIDGSLLKNIISFCVPGSVFFNIPFPFQDGRERLGAQLSLILTVIVQDYLAQLHETDWAAGIINLS